MLVAGAALSLIAPIAAQASDINLEEMDSYSRSNSSSKKQKLDSKTFANELATLEESVANLEDKFNDFEAGSFSDTTTLDNKVVFTLGAVDYDVSDRTEATKFS